MFLTNAINYISWFCNAKCFKVEDAATKPKHILDVGCGTGGSTRYLARKYGAESKGITISPGEVERARVLTAEQGLENQVGLNHF